jgi:hypothetical protein
MPGKQASGTDCNVVQKVNAVFQGYAIAGGSIKSTAFLS